MLPVNSATNLRLVFVWGLATPPPRSDKVESTSAGLVCFEKYPCASGFLSTLYERGGGSGWPKTKLALRLLPGGLIFRYQPELDSFVLVRKSAPMGRTCVSRDGGCVAAGKQTTLKIVAGWIDFQVAT